MPTWAPRLSCARARSVFLFVGGGDETRGRTSPRPRMCSRRACACGLPHLVPLPARTRRQRQTKKKQKILEIVPFAHIALSMPMSWGSFFCSIYLFFIEERTTQPLADALCPWRLHPLPDADGPTRNHRKKKGERRTDSDGRACKGFCKRVKRVKKKGAAHTCGGG